MTFKRLISLWRSSQKLYGKYKLQIIVLVILGFLSGLLEGIGVSILAPLFSYITQTGSQDYGFVSKVINGVFSSLHLEFRLQSLLALIVVMFTAKAVVIFIFEYIRARITTDYEQQTRAELYRRCLHARWSYLLKLKIGHIENILMGDVGASVKLLTNVANTILNLTSLVMYVLVAFTLSASVTLIALGVGLVVLIIFKPIINKLRAYSRQLTLIGKDIAHHINEGVLGLKVFKAMAVEESVVRTVTDFFQHLRGIVIKQTLTRVITNIAIQPITVIFIGVIFSMAFLQPGFSFAAFIAVTYMIQRIFVYVDKLQSSLQSINEGIPYASQVVAFKEATGRHKEVDSGNKDFSFKNEISFDQVDFSYETGKPILSGLNFSLERGKMLGIVGPSGVGKTTIADLLLRLFEPSSGRIKIDGLPINEIKLSALRQNVAYVSQELFLQNDTIRENIRFYDDRLSHEDIAAAAKVANIHSFVEKLPLSWETSVGERGVMLSAGQRQRIVLARALARRSAILILDEATSSLDNESEAAIKKAIEELRGEMTIIVIAHRLSTIMNADRLLVLKDGRIAEEGAPKDLLADPNSAFSKMNIIALGDQENAS